MTVVMVMNDFDLPVGSTASLAGVLAAIPFAQGFPIWVGVSAALGIGALGGVLNGVLVAELGILPFVATLGTQTIFSGLAFFISGGATIFGRDIPKPFAEFSRLDIPLDALGLAEMKLPYLTLVAVLVLLVVWILKEHTSYGRRLYANGGNIGAAHLAGVRVRRLRLSAFAVTGFGAAVAGLMFASRVASANPTQGAGLMLDAIAAVATSSPGRQG